MRAQEVFLVWLSILETAHLLLVKVCVDAGVEQMLEFDKNERHE